MKANMQIVWSDVSEKQARGRQYGGQFVAVASSSIELTSLELVLEDGDTPGSEIGPKGRATLGVETSRTEMLLKKQLTQDRHQQIQDDESRNECKQVRIAEAPKPCQKVQAITV